MDIEIKNKLTQLNHLLESAQNPKILLEEIQLVSEHAFSLQDELMTFLEEAENNEQDIQELQNIFTTREVVWDAVAQIAKREIAIKEKTYKKGISTTKSKSSIHNKGNCHHHKVHTCHDNACQESTFYTDHGNCSHTNNKSCHTKIRLENCNCDGGCPCKK